MFDAEAFRAINGLAGRSLTLDAIGIFTAKWLIWLMAAVPAVWALQEWWRSRRGKRQPLLKRLAELLTRRHKATPESAIAAIRTYAAVAAAYVFNAVIGLVWFRPRPFASLLRVQMLIDKSALDKSFPSDHATIAFALACSIAITKPKWGWLALIAAAMVAFGRVLVGVHYPLDVTAGAVLGCLWAMAARWVELRLRSGRARADKC